MKKRIAIALCIVAALLGVRACVEKQRTTVEQQTSPVLKEGEREKVIIDNRAGTVTRVRHSPMVKGSRRGSGGMVVRKETARKTVVTIKEDPLTKEPEVVVWTQTKGFTFEPGLLCGIVDRPIYGVDVLYAFRGKWGTTVGIVSDTKWKMRTFVAGTYQVYNNTHVFLGVTQKKDFIVGVRVSL